MKKCLAWILVLILCVSLLAACKKPESETDTTNADKDVPIAAKVGNHQITAVELNYYYIDAINTFYSNFQHYIDYLLITTVPLDEQIYDHTTGETWADYFVKQAYSNIKSTYALYDEAMANGFTLDETAQASMEDTFENLQMLATVYGFRSVDQYLESIYGLDATMQSYREYYQKVVIAESYYAEYSEALHYTPDQLNAYQASIPYQFDNYTYATYYLSVSRFYPEDAGTKGEDGKMTYTAEETAAAVQAARAAAEELAHGSYEDLEAFDKAINELDINRPANDGARPEEQKYHSTKHENVLYSSIHSLFRDWIVGIVEPNTEIGNSTYVPRIEGDMTIVASTSGEGEDKVINGFYVIRYGESHDNEFYMKNVRHILVKFSTSNPSSADKEQALNRAESLLSQWLEGSATEDTFAELAAKETDDTASQKTGGLYENIIPGQMVEAFEEWCFDENRWRGDYGIIETEYGYHIMYFVSHSELTYRQHLIRETMRNEETTEWYNALVEGISFTSLTEKYINKGITIE